MNELLQRILELATEAGAAACRAADADPGPPESFSGWRTVNFNLCGHPLSHFIEVLAMRPQAQAPAEVFAVEMSFSEWDVAHGKKVGTTGAPGVAGSIAEAAGHCVSECCKDLAQNPEWLAIEDAWELARSTPAACADPRGSKRL